MRFEYGAHVFLVFESGSDGYRGKRQVRLQEELFGVFYFGDEDLLVYGTLEESPEASL